MEIMDCTLRDGANIVGKGFSAKITEKILKILVDCKIPYIEFGNAGGIGAYEVSNFNTALTDKEYLEIGKEFINQGSKIGMFLNASRYREKYVDLANEYKLNFLRVGTDADDFKKAIPVIEKICDTGMEAYYSAMKAYIISSKEIVKSAKTLEKSGLKIFTIMDSAGTMTPEQVKEYISELKEKTNLKIAFHGHNNLGISVANGLAATKAGADIIDCGIMGMARSAGNIPTEVMIANLERQGINHGIDLYGLLGDLEDLEKYFDDINFKNYIKPTDLILGLSGAHSKNVPMFRKISDELNVDMFRLIMEVSRINRKNPSEDLIIDIARELGESHD